MKNQICSLLKIVEKKACFRSIYFFGGNILKKEVDKYGWNTKMSGRQHWKCNL